jgi:hypothetical protein
MIIYKMICVIQNISISHYLRMLNYTIMNFHMLKSVTPWCAFIPPMILWGYTTGFSFVNERKVARDHCDVMTYVQPTIGQNRRLHVISKIKPEY